MSSVIWFIVTIHKNFSNCRKKKCLIGKDGKRNWRIFWFSITKSKTIYQQSLPPPVIILIVIFILITKTIVVRVSVFIIIICIKMIWVILHPILAGKMVIFF